MSSRRQRPRLRLVLGAVVLLLLVLASALATAACGGGNGGGATDPVVAKVDGVEIRKSAVDGIRAETRLIGQKDDAAAALEQAIDRELLRREAARLGVTVAADAVDARLAEVAKSAGGEAALQSALKAAGMSEAQLRASLTAAVLLDRVRAAKYGDVSTTAAQAKAYYEKHRADLFTHAAAVKLGGIFVRNVGIAGNALKRLRQDRPFAEVAHQFSIDPQLKDAWGSMGWVDPRSLPGALSTTVAGLKDGAVSKPVAGNGGVWIFKAFGRRAAKVDAFASVRAQIIEELTAQKRGKKLRAWLAEARAKADVQKL